MFNSFIALHLYLICLYLIQTSKDWLQTASKNNPTSVPAPLPVALPLPAPLPLALSLPAPLSGSETLPVASPSWSARSTSPDVDEDTV